MTHADRMDRTLFRKCGDAVVRAAKFIAKPFCKREPMKENPADIPIQTVWANGFRMEVYGDKLRYVTSSPISGKDIVVDVRAGKR